MENNEVMEIAEVTEAVTEAAEVESTELETIDGELTTGDTETVTEEGLTFPMEVPNYKQANPTVMTVMGVVLLISALFLVIAVLMQNSKSHKLSGTIAGGAETFFGKTKGADVNKKLNVATAIVAAIFMVLVTVMYVIQPEPVITLNNEQEYMEYLEDIGYIQFVDPSEVESADASEEVTGEVSEEVTETVAE